MLPPCPSSPNCVSTQATDTRHAIAPIAFHSSPDAALAKIASIIASMPGAKIVEQTATAIRAEFRSRIFGFVDDVQFELDARKSLLHFRSASRVGRSDFGVNRKRMETIRARFTAR